MGHTHNSIKLLTYHPEETLLAHVPSEEVLEQVGEPQCQKGTVAPSGGTEFVASALTGGQACDDVVLCETTNSAAQTSPIAAQVHSSLLGTRVEAESDVFVNLADPLDNATCEAKPRVLVHRRWADFSDDDVSDGIPVHPDPQSPSNNM